MSNTGQDTPDKDHTRQNSTVSCSLDSSPHSTIVARRKSSILVSKPITVLPSPIPSSARADTIQFQETERKVTEVKEMRRSISVTRHGLRRHRRHSSVLTEASNWHGRERDRVKLVKEGYQSLAVLCTFIAGVQAQLLQMSYNQSDYASQVVNAFFFAGLFFDIGAAILAAASARWYEMLMPEEAVHVYDWALEKLKTSSSPEGSDNEEEGLKGAGSKEGGDPKEPVGNNPPQVEQTSIHISTLEAQVPSVCKPAYWIIERWLCLGLKAGIFVALLGLGFLATGVMIYIWAHTTLVVQALSTASCVFLFLLLPPFFLPHNRTQTLHYVRLKRHSG